MTSARTGVGVGVELTDLTPGLALLRAHEVDLGLDRYGRRAAMERRL